MAVDQLIVVLGGGLAPYSDQGMPDLMPNGLSRLRYGIWLSRRTEIDVGFTGGIPRNSSPFKTSEAVIAQRIASEEYKFNLSLTDTQAQDTRQNALYTAKLLKQANIEEVILVTQSWHMPRALRAFRNELGPGMPIIAAPMGQIFGETNWYWSWVPSVGGMFQSQMAMRETLALWANH